MPSASFGGGAVRVRAPEGYAATSAAERSDRGLPEPSSTQARKEGVVAALQQEDFHVVDRIDLTPRRTRDLETGGPAPHAGTVGLDVDVPADEDAVVLLERDGVYSWHFPAHPPAPLPAERTRGLEGTRTLTFRIDVDPAPLRTPAPGRRTRDLAPAEAERADRGLLGDLVHGAVEAIVLRFAAPAVLGKVVERLESSVRTGLVHITGEPLEAWKPIETLADVGLPAGRPARVLLLVHGTFSSTLGAFGALSLTHGAEGFVRTLVSAYDAVIGYDHRTLSLDPEQNARDLLDRLRVPGLPDDIVFDVVTHSRGGLVTRSFVETVLPQSGWGARVDSIVFVAATNGGTHLADPARWHDLVDLYTNLVTAAAAGLGLVPGALPFAAVVGGVVRAVGAFVKFLVSYAAEGREVPGIAAMMPDGPFVREINRMQPGQPGPGTDWYVISSDFHVSLLDDSHRPPEFPRELAVALAEGLVDGLFKGPNDLVVDVASMSAIGLPAGGFVRDTFALGSNDVVTHVSYFAQLDVIGRIAQWLPLGLGATAAISEEPADGGGDGGGGGERRTERQTERQTERRGLPGRGRGMAADEARPPAPPPMPRAVPPPPVPPPAMPPPPVEPAPAPTEPTTRATLAAEMPSTVTPDATFTVRVRLARGALTATEGTVSVTETVEVVAERPVSVQVYATENVEVLEKKPKDFGLPSGDWASELTFGARALGPGAVKVTVVLRQGSVVVASVVLEAVAAAAGMLAPPPQTRTVHIGADAPELDGLPCLDIAEGRRATGERVYSYAVRLVPGVPPELFESAPVIGRDDFVRERIAEVEAVIRDPDLSDSQRLKKLQNTGTLLFDQFFPEPMQAYLWEHRDELDGLIVYTDEPYVPWELVHLKPPRGKRGVEPRFLAQGGLVRWQLGSFPPKRLRVRSGRARTICPVYANPMFRNDVGAQEAAFLHDRLGARPVTATPTGVEKVLRGGRFDLLHFSGHGAARSDDIADAQVLLKGRRRGGSVVEQFLSATDVSENVDWADPDEGGPVVVLNACQTGRSGELFTTVGGFARAFLDAGASAFVSCLWSVHEEPSRVFVETLYDELLRGTPMARASALARTAAREAGDPTWLAYVVYARPDAVLETG